MVALPCPLAVRKDLALEASKLSTTARTDLYMKQMTEVATPIEFGKWLVECLKESFTASVAMDTNEEDLKFVGTHSLPGNASFGDQGSSCAPVFSIR